MTVSMHDARPARQVWYFGSVLGIFCTCSLWHGAPLCRSFLVFIWILTLHSKLVSSTTYGLFPFFLLIKWAIVSKCNIERTNLSPDRYYFSTHFKGITLNSWLTLTIFLSIVTHAKPLWKWSMFSTCLVLEYFHENQVWPRNWNVPCMI